MVHLVRPLPVVLLGPAASRLHTLLWGKWLINGTAMSLQNSRFLLEPDRATHDSRRLETLTRPVRTVWLSRVRDSRTTKLAPLRTPLTLWSVSRLPIPRARVEGI